MRGIIPDMGHARAQTALKQIFETAMSHKSHLNSMLFCIPIRTLLLITEMDNKLVYACPVH